MVLGTNQRKMHQADDAGCILRWGVVEFDGPQKNL